MSQITTIDSMQVFGHTQKLKEIDLSGLTVSTLEAYTCQYANGLEKVILSAAIKTIDLGCFRGCPKLTEVHLKSTTPPNLEVGSSASSYKNFKDSPNVILYVPASAVDAYKNATGKNGFSNPEYNGAASTTEGIQAKIVGE